MTFQGKRVLVTGGTSGIGAAIAAAFQGRGAAVTVIGLDADAIRASAQAGLDARQVDVCDGEALARLVAGFPALDVLVCCAGIVRRGEEHDPEVFARVVDVNLNGTMRVCTLCRPLLARSRGCIVNTASMLSFFGGPRVPAYSASKGGVAQLTKSLAIAYAADGIRVNAVAPGWIDTPLTEPLVGDSERSQSIVARTPLGRWGKPEDVAGPVLFLCSPDAAFVTGAVLPVDGGYLIS